MNAVWAAFDATWPAVEYATAGAFRVARGTGAGERVRSAVPVSDPTLDDIAQAEAAHRRWGQPALFRVMADDAALRDALIARGYRRHDGALLMTAPVAALTDQALPPVTAIPVWPPLAIQRDLWDAGDFGPARRDVMARVAGDKVSILGRINDRAAGTAFVGHHDGVVMVHALIVLPEFRRSGLAGWMMRQAAFWGAERGASQVALAVGTGNIAARALYDGLGFQVAGAYDYLMRD
ncbi:N-acetyltransferase [Paracoccus sp. (in: a-proteobacteria)]|uniref:GNAT family N-acetyltransferase n=1 Tax=Paracoccus sp. TaxID=267 RepID=UPI0026DFD2B0|nr:GNAT family N-acetyltransferase [Paracoccus sp. (in: a-proteobacteria)]MDO5647755.1 GNAT family N-acetyltransferase [Paracoccus sp. (in: a-proteobacteria)]